MAVRTLTSPALLSQPSFRRPTGERREKASPFPLSPAGVGGGLGEGAGGEG
jgi:hypothetical protein